MTNLPEQRADDLPYFVKQLVVCVTVLIFNFFL